MKRPVLAVLLLLASCCSGDIRKTVVESARNRNVWVANQNDMSCAGVIYRTGIVITARHCIGEGLTVNGHPAKILKTGADDLLLLSADTPEFEPLRLNLHLTQGDTVFAVGNQAGYSDFFSQGHVARITASQGDVPARIWTEGVVAVPGVSGAALFDSEGRLVGINVEIIGTFLPNGASATVCGRSVPAEAIAELVR